MTPTIFGLILTAAVAANHPLETVPAGEKEAIAKITAMIAHGVKAQHAAQGIAKRDAHNKHHGCVRAEVKMNDQIAPELRSSVFVEGRTYPAWIRFSNGQGKAQADTEGDGRGMALKLMNVDGAGTQDFLMINHPVFFVRNVADYVEFTKAVGTGNPRPFFFGFSNPLKWRLHEMGIAQAIRGKTVTNPLAIQYFSMTPVALGEGAMKYSARPCSVNGHVTVPPSENFLREAMSQELSKKHACFELLVQRQTDPKSMPIEDPTIDWSQKLSPYRKVGTIVIPQQSFESKEQMEFCENLSFTPWHTVADHRPIGGIQRARKAIYDTISDLRHDLNKVKPFEPTAND